MALYSQDITQVISITLVFPFVKQTTLEEEKYEQKFQHLHMLKTKRGSNQSLAEMFNFEKCYLK